MKRKYFFGCLATVFILPFRALTRKPVISCGREVFPKGPTECAGLIVRQDGPHPKTEWILKGELLNGETYEGEVLTNPHRNKHWGEDLKTGQIDLLCLYYDYASHRWPHYLHFFEPALT